MIEDYLAQLQSQAVGEATAGSFSLDLRAQAQKMLKFQSAQPALWLLKMVQAAVASGSGEVRIQLNRGHFEIRFTPLLELEGKWAEHLHFGLLAALASPAKSVLLSWNGRVLHGETAVVPGPQMCLRLERQPGFLWGLFDPEPGRLAAEVVRRCQLCPIPIWLDGRLLNTCDPNRLTSVMASGSFQESARSLRWLGERSWFGREADHFGLAQPYLRPAVRLSTRDEEILSFPGGDRVRKWLPFQATQSQIKIVRRPYSASRNALTMFWPCLCKVA